LGHSRGAQHGGVDFGAEEDRFTSARVGFPEEASDEALRMCERGARTVVRDTVVEDP
jgi:hypothetical protein